MFRFCHIDCKYLNNKLRDHFTHITIVFIFVRLHTLRNIKPKIIVQVQNFFHGGNWISEVLYLFAHRHSKKSRGAFFFKSSLCIFKARKEFDLVLYKVFCFSMTSMLYFMTRNYSIFPLCLFHIMGRTEVMAFLNFHK